jgi:uncharacterized protein
MAAASETERQNEVIAFLADSATYPPGRDHVDRIETHGALVFIAGPQALKIKRAVRTGYFDFSTLEKREAVCRREIEINRPNAPDIYRDVVAITRESDGRLAIDGKGTPVEWAVRMASFSQDALLSTVAEQHGIDDRLATALAETVLAAHAKAEPRRIADAPQRMRRIVADVAESIAASTSGIAGTVALRQHFTERAEAALARASAILGRRAEAGLVRRCHGDMHLGNIVLWQGHPQLFDAIEFDETLATIDLLYDLAFLVMDLDRRGQGRAAHIVLDRYLGGSERELDIEGLAALPLFLGLRAAIRAMVAFDRARIQEAPQRSDTEQHGVETLSRAIDYLQPPRPRLIAVGGLSGTGKTTLAAGLAPCVLPAPGALHLRSDVMRKRLAGVGELARLPPEAYTPEASERVYRALTSLARKALAVGHSVVVDAVFARPEERTAFGQVAASLGIPFDGVWLDAAPDLLRSRVAARRGDASDATPEVVERQLGYDTGSIGWHRIAATGALETVLATAVSALGLDAVR